MDGKIWHRTTGAWAVLFGIVFIFAFRGRLAGLWALWWGDSLASVGLVVPLVSGALIWRKRRRLELLPAEPSLLSLPFLLIFAVGVYLARLPTGLLFLIYWTGAALAIGGRKLVKEIAFPLAFLVLVVPIPAPIAATSNYPLQLFFAEATARLAGFAGVAVVRDGSMLRLPATAITIAPECNGLRTMTGLFLVSVITAYVSKGPPWARLLLVALSVPLAYVCNLARLLVDVLVVSYLSVRYEQYSDLGIGLAGFIIACFIFLRVATLLKCQPALGYES